MNLERCFDVFFKYFVFFVINFLLSNARVPAFSSPLERAFDERIFPQQQDMDQKKARTKSSGSAMKGSEHVEPNQLVAALTISTPVVKPLRLSASWKRQEKRAVQKTGAAAFDIGGTLAKCVFWTPLHHPSLPSYITEDVFRDKLKIEPEQALTVHCIDFIYLPSKHESTNELDTISLHI